MRMLADDGLRGATSPQNVGDSLPGAKSKGLNEKWVGGESQWRLEFPSGPPVLGHGNWCAWLLPPLCLPTMTE